MPNTGIASAHLASRLEVEQTLLEAAPEALALRASIVIGARSRSFRFLVRLVERVPVMPLPAWRENRTQPIDGRDVLSLLIAGGRSPAVDGPLSLDIAGPDVVTYGQLITRIRDALLVGRAPIRLGFSLTPVASRVAAAIAGEDHALIGPLMEGLMATCCRATIALRRSSASGCTASTRRSSGPCATGRRPRSCGRAEARSHRLGSAHVSAVATTIDIDASLEDVWRTVMDPTRLGEWVTIHRKLISYSEDEMEQVLHLPRRQLQGQVASRLQPGAPSRDLEGPGPGARTPRPSTASPTTATAAHASTTATSSRPRSARSAPSPATRWSAACRPRRADASLQKLKAPVERGR